MNPNPALVTTSQVVFGLMTGRVIAAPFEA
jgi:hypothetical protein